MLSHGSFLLPFLNAGSRREKLVGIAQVKNQNFTWSSLLSQNSYFQSLFWEELHPNLTGDNRGKKLMSCGISLKKWEMTTQPVQFQHCCHCSALSGSIHPYLNYMLILPCINYLHFTNVFFKMFQTLVLCWFCLQLSLSYMQHCRNMCSNLRI